ncbi:hypothetical protein DMA11_16170 [Marinilabiliaceae bacterium JC017]|nr:hypothetical protein DMA11_16170 [Marinilabiliaceae bacterium JC017]
MKKVLLLVAVLVAGITSSFAQSSNYRAFKVDLGGAYAIPSGDGIKAGVGFYLEPKYNVTDNLALGLKMEWAAMGAEDVQGMSVSVSTLGTYQLTGDYYFGDSFVRPFVGIGTGIYSLGTVEVEAENAVTGDEVMNMDYGTKFGFAPRAGILIGHFRVGVEYNVITGIDSELESKNYLSFKLGFEIGGGSK